MSYQAILFAPDGDYVTDYAAETIDEVWERIDNGGSRWFFYPFAFVITDRGAVSGRQRIVGAPDYPPSLAYLEGRSVAVVRAYLAEEGERIAASFFPA